MLSRRSFVGGGLAAATLALSGRRAEASVARALSLGELVAHSQHAVVGTPVDGFARWERIGGRDRIVTYTLLRVDYSVDGRPPPTPELMVRTLGGQVDDVGQVVAGEAILQRNEAATVFLSGISRDLFSVTAMAQGHYRLLMDPNGTRRLRSNARGLELILRADAAVQRLDGRTVSEAERMIYEEVARGSR